jgi:hypothetical protein
VTSAFAKASARQVLRVRPARVVLGAVVSTITLSTVLTAVEFTLDRRGIEQAIYIGQGRDAERELAQRPYRLAINRPPLDYIDVVTPFRRVLLFTEQQRRIGNRSVGQRQAIELLNEAPGQIDLWVEFTFHPLNTYVGVPNYDVVLMTPTGMAIKPKALDRVPRFGPRMNTTPLPYPRQPGRFVVGDGQPMLSGTVAVSFDETQLTNSVYDVVVSEAGKELGRARLALPQLR